MSNLPGVRGGCFTQAFSPQTKKVEQNITANSKQLEHLLFSLFFITISYEKKFYALTIFADIQ